MLARLILTTALALPVLLSGCPDTSARLDRFTEHREPFIIIPLSAECEEPVDMTGAFFLAVATTLGPGSPILFKADVTVDLDANAITLEMRALAVEGRAEVGEVHSATSALDAEGGFVLDFGQVVVPAAANPILVGVEVKALLVFSGCTASEEFACGVADGQVIEPANVPIDGSAWAMVRLEAGVDPAELEPIGACPE